MFRSPFQVFLGARYDRQLTFAEHVRKLCQSMSDRFTLLRALGGTTWGWHTPDCRQVYITIVRSMLEYVAAAWAPWLSATSASKLEKVQLESSRAITSLVCSTPVEAVLAESQFTDGSVRDEIEDGGAGLVVLSQDDLVHGWHAPKGKYSNYFLTEKSALKETIQWLSSTTSWASVIIVCDCKSLVQAFSNANSAD